jgi:hypothetical protein
MVFIFGLIFALPISSASNVTNSSSAVNVKITPTTVTATGYNSASGGYFWTTGTFENYDPFLMNGEYLNGILKGPQKVNGLQKSLMQISV